MARKNGNHVGIYNSVRLVNLELPLKEPVLFVSPVKASDSALKPAGIPLPETRPRDVCYYDAFLNHERVCRKAIRFLVWKENTINLVRISIVVRLCCGGLLSNNSGDAEQKNDQACREHSHSIATLN